MTEETTIDAATPLACEPASASPQSVSQNVSLQRLQDLLRDLFQFDYADLDFGVYRLLRLKRNEVEAFLSEQLPSRVDEVFKVVASDIHGNIAREIAELADRVRREIDAEAL